MKPPFPTGKELEETVAVMRVLEAAREPLTIEQIARHFAQGKQIEKRAGLVVAALGAARAPRLRRRRQNRLAPRRRLTALTVRRKDRSSTVNGSLPKQAAP